MNTEILLFWPNSSWAGKRQRLGMPHSILILTRILHDGHRNVALLDANIHAYSPQDCARIIAERRPRIVMVSGLSAEFWEHCHMAMDIAKGVDQDILTICGGVYPTTMPNEALQCRSCDYIYVGPAEDRLLDVLDRLDAGDLAAVRAMPGIGYRDTDGAPVVNPYDVERCAAINPLEPDYSLVEVTRYLAPNPSEHNLSFAEPTANLLTSYGCFFHCVFCASRTIRGRNYAYRSAENVLREIAWFYHTHAIRHFTFIDELFLGNRERVEAILHGLRELGQDIRWKVANGSIWHIDEPLLEAMHAAGCRRINLSVESGSQRVLREIIHKPIKLEMFAPVVCKCKALGIDVAINFVIGFPGETWEEIRQTIDFAEQLDPDLAVFHVATPMPCTELYTLARDQRLLPEDFDFRSPDFFGTGRGFITTEEFTPMELMILRAFEWDRINFKTPEKTRKVASMFNMRVEDLNEHRKQSRRALGLSFLKNAKP